MLSISLLLLVFCGLLVHLDLKDVALRVLANVMYTRDQGTALILTLLALGVLEVRGRLFVSFFLSLVVSPLLPLVVAPIHLVAFQLLLELLLLLSLDSTQQVLISFIQKVVVLEDLFLSGTHSIQSVFFEGECVLVVKGIRAQSICSCLVLKLF